MLDTQFDSPGDIPMLSYLSDSWSQKFQQVIRRHTRILVLVPVVSLIAGAIFFVFCPRTYRSEARFFLRNGRETVGVDPTATTGQILPFYTTDLKDEVKSAQEIFKSRSVASQVVDRLGADVVLGRGPGAPKTNFIVAISRLPLELLVSLIKSIDPISEREEAIITVERNLSIGGERQATVIVLQYDAKSPQLAQTVCQAIVDVVRQEYIRVHRSEQSNPFFAEQQRLLRDQLDKSLEALRDAKNELGLANVEQRRTTLEAQYNAIELDRLSTSQQLATAQAQIESLQRQLADIPERMIASERRIPNQGADLLRNRFYELQLSTMDLESHYREAHPYVRAKNDQLQEAEKVLGAQAEERTETTDAINPIHQKLALVMKQERSVVAGLRSRLEELDQQRKGVLADLRTVNQHDLKIDQLTRESELARSKYMQYARTLEEARVDEELQNVGVSNISVVQPATLAEKPVVPSRGMTAAGVFVLAIAGTAGLVLLNERPTAPAPPASKFHPNDRRAQRRRVRRQLVSKTNGDTIASEMNPSAR
jgi:uncharacterized protein involved in exopolysaccharide biosynthesis